MKTPVILVILVAALIVLASSAYIVDQKEQVIITEFGKPVRIVNSDPNHNQAGLHFKKPFIQQVNHIEKRILEWDGPAIEMSTRDKLYITVNNFGRWRIADPQVYFERLHDERSALSRLDDIIGSETRNIIAAHDLIEVIRSDKGRTPERDEAITDPNSNLGMLPPIQYGRSELNDKILHAAQPKVKDWGLELIDVRFKRINYKAGVIGEIYARMASERLQIAERFRSEGAGEAAKIIGRRERELLTIESGAYRKEQEIKGKADATATGIYAAAYNSSPAAADFYQFTKTLDIYRNALGKDSTVILTSNSDLLRLFKHIEKPAAK